MPEISTPPLQVAVIGAGAFGRNHARVYQELAASPQNASQQDAWQQDAAAATSQVALAAIVDPSAAVRAAASARFDVRTFASVEELLASGLRLDAASVCVPTVHHAAVAESLLRAGIDVLIEKPFAATLAEADGVLALATAGARIVQVGHLERFNPAVTAAAALRNSPMFFESHRLSIFTPRSLDVDVVLDLMIHDLDIVLTLAASPVREIRAVGLPVLSRKVDIANVRVEFDSGCIANFTASRISTEQVRKLRFFQPRQYLSLDFARQELLAIDVASGSADAAALSSDAAAQSSAAHPSAGLSLRKVQTEKTEPLRLELLAFLDAVRTRQQPVVTGDQGRAALALALEINAAMAAHARRAGLHNL